MGLAARFQARFTNDAVEATNYQEFGLEIGADVPAIGLDVVSAQIIAYCSCALGLVSAEDTRLEQLSYIAAGTNVAVPVPFPTAAYATLRTANVAVWVRMQPMTAYGVDIGLSGAPLAPLGTSVVVSEYTAVGGPAGRGRHYLPFVSVFPVDVGGVCKPVVRVDVADAYNAFIRDGVTPNAVGVVDLLPVVENAARTVNTAITSVKVQPVFSNLESRRR